MFSVQLPITKCTLRLSSIRDRRETFESGHIQVWREVLDGDYERDFTYIPPARRSSEANQPISTSPRHRQDSTSAQLSRTMTVRSGLSISSGSSGSTSRVANGVKTHRLFIFIPGPPSRCVTINLTNKCCKPHLRQNANRHISSCHVTFTAQQGNFFAGNWTSDKHCPGIPLNPEVLADREDFHVDWVELEFRDSNAMARFENLWNTLFPNEQ